MRREDIVWRTIPRRGGLSDLDYDVSISQSKSKDGRIQIRFGLLNKAKRAFAGAQYMAISSVEASPYRIYFLASDECKTGMRKISGNQGCKSISITPTDKERDIFNEKWVGYHKLKFDMESQLHYIETEVRA